MRSSTAHQRHLDICFKNLKVILKLNAQIVTRLVANLVFRVARVHSDSDKR